MTKRYIKKVFALLTAFAMVFGTGLVMPELSNLGVQMDSVSAIEVGGTIEYVLDEGDWIEDYSAPDHYIVGEHIDLPPAEKVFKKGYVFGGWYDSNEFKGKPVTEISSNASGTKTFYARWYSNTYTFEIPANMDSYNIELGGCNEMMQLKVKGNISNNKVVIVEAVSDNKFKLKDPSNQIESISYNLSLIKSGETSTTQFVFLQDQVNNAEPKTIYIRTENFSDISDGEYSDTITWKASFKSYTDEEIDAQKDLEEEIKSANNTDEGPGPDEGPGGPDKQSYIITYELHNSSAQMSNNAVYSVHPGDTIGSFPDPQSEDGKVFAGWFTENGAPWDLENDSVDDDLTLYAHWNDYNIG